MSETGLARDEEALRGLHRDAPVHLVPTMGALHDGHLALLRHARGLADQDGGAVCASVFVNPLQFGPGEDLDEYPRRLGSDLATMSGLADTCFAPEAGEFFPEGQEVYVDAPGLGRQLCGVDRPTHFRGVLTVVYRLFRAVRPATATFGEKDYQQLVLIRKMAEQLRLGVRIESVPTVREADGLALSSRNERLGGGAREVAPRLHQELEEAAGKVEEGVPADEACGGARDGLARSGFEVSYVECRSLGLGEFSGPNDGFAVLAAATLDGVRLIDNALRRP